MSESRDRAARLSVEDRLTALGASQDQLQRAVEDLTGQVKSLSVLGIYTAGLALLIVLALKSGRFKLPAGS